MRNIRAIGFDLFGTLVYLNHRSQDEARRKLVEILRSNGFALETGPFLEVYLASVNKFRAQARNDHVETHNRFWISEALRQSGFPVFPDDPRIGQAVEAYFREFNRYLAVLPGTLEMLASLRKRYRLGLLSNFTHAPAIREALPRLGLYQYLDFILISGEIGHRKPGAVAFSRLIENFGLPGEEIAFVGDDPRSDIQGARAAGIQPVWTLYARRYNGWQPEEPEFPVDSAVPRVENWEELLSLFDVASKHNARE